MDLKGLVNKARAALQKNPNLIEKGGDAIDKVTKNKYAGHVDKAQDAVRKAVGAQQNPGQQNPQNPGQNPTPNPASPPANPGQPLPGQQSPDPQNPQK